MCVVRTRVVELDITETVFEICRFSVFNEFTHAFYKKISNYLFESFTFEEAEHTQFAMQKFNEYFHRKLVKCFKLFSTTMCELSF